MRKTLIWISVCLFTWPVVAGSQTTAFDTVAGIPAHFKVKKEPRFYLTVHGGYSVALGSTFKFYPDDISSIAVTRMENLPPEKRTSYSATSKGLGEGARFGAGLSYIINDFINVGIDVDYLNTTISRNRDSSFYQQKQTDTTDYRYKQQYTISYRAKLITIAPNITFKAISRPRFFIYNKLGAIFTFRPNSIQTETQKENLQMAWQGFFKDSSAESTKRYEWGIRNPAFGFMGAIGVQFKLTEKVRAYAETQFTHVVFAVKNRILTNYNVNGKELSGTLTRSEKEIVFENNFVDSESPANTSLPAVASRQRFPISYVGVQAGIAYRF